MPLPDAKSARNRETISGPIRIGDATINRRGDMIRATFAPFGDNQVICEFRILHMTQDGTLLPTAKSFAIFANRLPAFAELLQKAIEKAIALGIIDEPAPKGRDVR
jgi:hypothetical protein